MHLHPDSSPEDLYPHLLDALNAWHSSSSEDLLEDLLLVREAAAEDSAEDVEIRRRTTNELLLNCIETLARHHPENAEILRGRFPRGEKVLKVAHSVNLSEDQVKRRQKQAILQLAEILIDRELALRERRTRELETRLPGRQYSRLFGIDDAVEELAEILIPGSPPWLVSLHGMGGIGKTALAHALALSAVADYNPERILWVRVSTHPGIDPEPKETYRAVLNDLAAHLTIGQGSPKTRRDQVLRILSARPHLVVIDNLELKSDTAYLLERLSVLQGPGKFLLTTRSGQIGTSGVHNYPVPELDEEDTAALIRFHSRDIGMGDMAITKEEDIRAIRAAVGGNPLAIRLVVGMTASIPLSAALADLGRRQMTDTDGVFERVYRRAWESLGQDARDLLEGMLLVSDETGAGPEQLLAFSGLPEARLWPAIQELLGCSLLEAHGTASKRRYGIHQLTRAFLQSRIEPPE